MQVEVNGNGQILWTDGGNKTGETAFRLFLPFASKTRRAEVQVIHGGFVVATLTLPRWSKSKLQGWAVENGVQIN
jgi:hypothetical protein